MKFAYFGAQTPHENLLKDTLATGPKLVAIDTETRSLEDHTLVGVAMAFSPTDTFYFSFQPDFPEDFPWEILRDPSVKKVFHNALFDIDVLLTECPHMDTENVEDTYLMARLLCFQECGLKNLAWMTNLTYEPADELMKKYHVETMDRVPVAIVAEKCCTDASITFRLYQRFLEDVDREYLKWETALLPIITAINRRGVKLDQTVRQELEEELSFEVEMYRDIGERMGFNPASPKQVGEMLVKQGVRLPRTPKGAYATDAEVLSGIDNPIASLVLSYREKAKLLSTYVQKLKGRDRIYTHLTFKPRTGRLASEDENMQNFPKGRIRNMFLPDNGEFTDVDYSQIELRVLAYVSGDKLMQSIFAQPMYLPDGSENPEADIHGQTAKALGTKRSVGKTFNFALVYGSGVKKLATKAGIGFIQAREFRDGWFRTYKQAGEYIYEMSKLGSGDYVTTLMGRKIQVFNDPGDPTSASRKAINTPIQGSAAEIIKRAMVKVKHLPMVLQVHDELLFDGRCDLPEEVEWIGGFHTPMTVAYLKRWE